MNIIALYRLLRPHQYLKNAFVWVGLMYFRPFAWPIFPKVSILFLAFCAAASSVYIFNDIFDMAADRLHPTKRNRPIANGTVSLPLAWGLSIMLAVLALLLAGWVGSVALRIIAIYLIINAAYSIRFKEVVILDVFIISAGFMLRILAGTMGVGIPPSQWLLLTGLMLTLFLGFAKRRAELLLLENMDKNNTLAVRRVLHDYSPVVLDQLTSITAACTVLSYGLYTVSADTIKAHGSYGLFYTLPFIVYGVFRYVFLLHQHSAGSDTAKDLISDPHLLITGVIWLLLTVAVLT